MEVTDLPLTTFDSVEPTAEWSHMGCDVASTVSPMGQPFQTRQCDHFQFVFYGIFASTLGLLGLLGNAASVAILGQDRTSPVAAFQLRSLAVADNLFLLLWLIQYSVRYAMQAYRLTSDQHLRTAWLYARMLTFPMLYMAQSGTIWLTVVAALNRYVAVCLPFHAHLFGNMSTVRKQVVVVAFAAVVYNIPRFFELKVVDAGNGTTTWNRTELGYSKVYKVIYTDALYYLLTFVVPLVTLAYMNTRVIVTYRATCRRRRVMSSRRGTTDQEQAITLVMIVIVVVFLACQTPARIVQMAWAYSFSDCNQLRFYLIHVSNLLEVLNSSVNFLVYSAFYKQFRAILRSVFRCGRRASDPGASLELNSVQSTAKTLDYRHLPCNDPSGVGSVPLGSSSVPQTSSI